MPSRLATLPPIAARLVLAFVAALAVWGMTLSVGHGPRLVAAAQSDSGLYRAIAARVGAGQEYHAAAVAEQRARGYPLRPFVTVREPALAWVSGRIGATASVWLLRLLTVAALGAVLLRLRGGPLPERIATMLLATLSVMMLADPVMALWHETWAALLLALTVAIRTERRWWMACVIGCAAMLVRELAAPAIVAMLGCALLERRRGEAIGWALALAVFAVTLGWHAHAVAGLVRPDDLASPGWTRLGGWGFVLAIARGSTLFALLPALLTAVAVPLALLGWVSRRDGFGLRVATALIATILPFMVVGRPDNFYWGLMVAPLLPVGLAFAPRGVRDLLRAARQVRLGPPSVRAWTADASS